MSSISRRFALKLMSLGSASLAPWRTARANESSPAKSDAVPEFASEWDRTPDRVWIGRDFWANPMEDWRIAGGAARCLSRRGGRSLHLIAHTVDHLDAGRKLMTEVTVNRVEAGTGDSGAGFRFGIASDIDDHRAHSFARGGINAGWVGGSLKLAGKTAGIASDKPPKSVKLRLELKSAEKDVTATLSALDLVTGHTLGTVETTIPKARVIGNLALVANYDGGSKRNTGAGYEFREWTGTGDMLSSEDPDQRRFGPILWTMYTLNDSRSDEGFVLKLSALTGPMGEEDNGEAELQIKDGKGWKSIGTAELDPDAWTATFRIPNWDASRHRLFRVKYVERFTDGTTRDAFWNGTIRLNPSGRPLRMAALTCQNDYAFPYAPVAENVRNLEPDLIYFSGDQLYEGHGGFGIIREPAEPAILNYLRKFYQFGWAFRDAMRHAPTVCLPDDHDVFQGNIWGEAGAAMELGRSTSANGGYRQPARMVNVVHLTNCGHHPEPYDPTPVKRDISVYYTDLVYGDVSFAIIADRMFKSSPTRVRPNAKGRADHVTDPNLDPKTLDQPGLELLGDRQEKFLAQWADDWRAHSMKVLLSESVFSAVATHHGAYNGFLIADLDANGWPQTPRDRAISILRKAMPLHINGDQHLATLTQYGVEKQRDSFWSFCTPAIAVGYPRWWRPDDMNIPHENRPKHNLPNTGEFLDGFGNKVYLYAVGNPIVPTARNRYDRAHQKGSGFGFVEIDPESKTYTMHAFRFSVDATKPDAEQFPGWPLTIHQSENRGENRVR